MAAESGRIATHYPWSAIHGRLDGIGILDDDRNLRIVIPKLRPVVDVGTSTDDGPVVRNKHLFKVNRAIRVYSDWEDNCTHF
jgi:hypothetical protein